MKNNYDKDRASINNINYINKVNDNKLQLITNSNEYYRIVLNSDE